MRKRTIDEKTKEILDRNVEDLVHRVVDNMHFERGYHGLVATDNYVLTLNGYVKVTTREEALETMRNTIRGFVDTLLTDDHPAFVFETGVAKRFPGAEGGMGAPFPDNKGWEEIDAYLRERYGEYAPLMFDVVTEKTNNAGLYKPLHFNLVFDITINRDLDNLKVIHGF